MADVIETLEVSQMLANTAEFKRQFRWIMEIDGLDAFTCVSTARPQFTIDETEINYLNEKRWIAGKVYPNTLPLTLRDPIAPSAAQKVMQWLLLCYEPLTGRAGYASFYQKPEVALKLLDPVGAVVEKWILKRVWIKDVNFQTLDYATNDEVRIDLTLRYDKAILEF